MEQHSKFHSILRNRCPRCHKGKVFVTDNPYDLRQFATMEKACPECNMDFRQEPGFYFGATYVSYAIQVGTVLACYLVFDTLLNWGIWQFVGATVGLLLLMLPLTFRTSRLTWLTFFGDKNRTGKN
ncbi:MAG TPA: DUF983 domain-containing protein [Bacteroidia bacterium]|jgi:uncharacterized protein (DUF983 family)